MVKAPLLRSLIQPLVNFCLDPPVRSNAEFQGRWKAPSPYKAMQMLPGKGNALPFEIGEGQ
jgi:hypothetical protein